ncbi:glycosyltransferase family 61 protein [Paracoccus sp. 1_MG-2023]|uniref:glycosyltransferase 61 family protein n=1 Tax=unclassified Paracoccus (in: a-proteobacteria) TaxID=2688777 RepID=UPI0020913F43|nr:MULTISPECIES: glycosyltransferase family 61 protein [unclassified Paracoccus (in: a-proteobacteria)]MDO6669987.1 glycosyltransferase family 61 protein [Paracoccus sp. 1_MG-2023]
MPIDPKQVVSTPDAFSLAVDRVDRRLCRFGLYDGNGVPIPHGDVVGDTFVSRIHEGPLQPAPSAERIEGPVLFAGGADKQFGFFLTSGLGRLWALDHLPAETKLFYATRPQKQQPGYGFIPQVLSSLGIRNEVVLSDRPLRFDMLHTASEIFGERWGGTGRPEFYDWLDERWQPSGAVDPDDRLYVTRSGMEGIYGRFACEDHLEELLSEQGYEIFAPEKYSISEQVARYQRAGRLIFSEGSALHLFGLVKRPGQMFATIQRRAALPDLMLRQLADRRGGALVAIDVIDDILYPPRRGAHLALSVLDFERLGRRLLDEGFIGSTASWEGPDDARLTASRQSGLAEGERLLTRDEYKAMLSRIRARRARKQSRNG